MFFSIKTQKFRQFSSHFHKMKYYICYIEDILELVNNFMRPASNIYSNYIQGVALVV